MADEGQEPKASAPDGEATAKPEAAPPVPAKVASSPEKKAPEKAEDKPAPPARQSSADTQALLSRGIGAEQVDDIRPRIPAFKVPADRLLEAVKYLHDELAYDHLACLTAIDWKQGRLEVVYNLWSYAKNRPIALRVEASAENPVVPSVTGVWKGADWLEREEYDLMGIRFEGHPDLRRILLPEGWQGHPLRKDYDWKKEQFVALDDKGENVVYQEAREDAW